jgi:hypothetical protein
MHGVPLKAILFGRHIGMSGACPICYQEDEDVLHITITTTNKRSREADPNDLSRTVRKSNAS